MDWGQASGPGVEGWWGPGERGDAHEEVEGDRCELGMWWPRSLPIILGHVTRNEVEGPRLYSAPLPSPSTPPLPLAVTRAERARAMHAPLPMWPRQTQTGLSWHHAGWTSPPPSVRWHPWWHSLAGESVPVLRQQGWVYGVGAGAHLPAGSHVVGPG